MRQTRFFFFLFSFFLFSACSTQPESSTGFDSDAIAVISCEGDDTRGYLWTAQVTPVEPDDFAPICIYVEYRKASNDPPARRTIYAKRRWFEDYHSGTIWLYEASCTSTDVEMVNCTLPFQR